MFIIIRSDGKYVAMPGSGHSYTSKLEEARIYTRQNEADTDKCPENERVAPLTSVLLGLQR